MSDRVKRISAVPALPKRRRDAHKGSFGRALVVGGSRGMSGAAALATLSALRGGAGLVEFAAPECVQLTIAGLCPCAVSTPLACDASGVMAPAAVAQILARAQDATVLAVGPGMGQGGPQQNVVRAALEQEKPVVLDADGLNNLVRIDDWPALRRCPLVLTPHPGEFARLIGKTTKEVQAEREALAVNAARAWSKGLTIEPQCPDAKSGNSQFAFRNSQLVLVLKGAGTVVTDGRRVFINKTGNPGMATGGTGDVLTGLTAAFIAQGLDLFDAACLAVHLHGRAGDLAANKLGQPSLIASDLIDFLPKAMIER